MRSITVFRKTSAARTPYPAVMSRLASGGFFKLRSTNQPNNEERFLNAKVADVMAADVIVATPGDLVGGVRELMSAHDIHSLPVVDEEKQLVGMITSTDLVPGFSAKIPVSRIMSTHVYTVTPQADVRTAAQMMRQYGVHHLVVTDGEKVVGVLSSLDLLRLLAEG